MVRRARPGLSGSVVADTAALTALAVVADTAALTALAVVAAAGFFAACVIDAAGDCRGLPGATTVSSSSTTTTRWMALLLVAQRARVSAEWLGEEVLRRSVPLPNRMRLKLPTATP